MVHQGDPLVPHQDHINLPHLGSTQVAVPPGTLEMGRLLQVLTPPPHLLVPGIMARVFKPHLWAKLVCHTHSCFV